MGSIGDRLMWICDSDICDILCRAGCWKWWSRTCWYKIHSSIASGNCCPTQWNSSFSSTRFRAL